MKMQKKYLEIRTKAEVVILLIACISLINIFWYKKFELAGEHFEYNDASHFYEFTSLKEKIRNELNQLKDRSPIQRYKPNLERVVELGDVFNNPGRKNTIEYFDALFLYTTEIINKLKDLESYSFEHFLKMQKVLEKTKMMLDESKRIAIVLEENDVSNIGEKFKNLVIASHKLQQANTTHEQLSSEWVKIKKLMINDQLAAEESADMLMRMANLVSALQADPKAIIRLDSDVGIHVNELSAPILESHELFKMVYSNHNKLSAKFEEEKFRWFVLSNSVLLLLFFLKDKLLIQLGEIPKFKQRIRVRSTD